MSHQGKYQMKREQLSRRDWLKAGAVLGAAAAVAENGHSAEALPSATASNSMPEGLAQKFTVAARLPDGFQLIHDPGMTVLPDGRILAASPAWKRANEGHVIIQHLPPRRHLRPGGRWGGVTPPVHSVSSVARWTEQILDPA